MGLERFNTLAMEETLLPASFICRAAAMCSSVTFQRHPFWLPPQVLPLFLATA